MTRKLQALCDPVSSASCSLQRLKTISVTCCLFSAIDPSVRSPSNAAPAPPQYSGSSPGGTPPSSGTPLTGGSGSSSVNIYLNNCSINGDVHINSDGAGVHTGQSPPPGCTRTAAANPDVTSPDTDSDNGSMSSVEGTDTSPKGFLQTQETSPDCSRTQKVVNEVSAVPWRS